MLDGAPAMCVRSVEVLTYPAMLEDPLIHLMMTSDGVTEDELRALMGRMRAVIAARGALFTGEVDAAATA